jgi:DNA-binding MarR family transcriptional regulator
MKKSKHEKTPFRVHRAEESSGFLLWQATTLWQREIRKALEPLNITHSQFVLLASIYWLKIHSQEVSQVLLSDHTKIDPMTTSTVIRTLVSKGLVKRELHTIDTRIKTVDLTEKGKSITSEAIKIVEKADIEYFSILGKDQKFLNGYLNSLLEKNNC